MSLALLFPGQGTQHAGMLAWLDDCPEAAESLGLLAAQLGADWRSRLDDAQWANRNAVAQPLLTGLGLAAWQCVAARLPAPAVIAGYSVGELPAFCVAGVFDARVAMSLARERAAAMERSAAGHATGLLAVHGIGPSAVAGVCRRHGLAVAIRLAADRVVLGGLSAALCDAEAGLAAQGIRCTRLAVNVASHTPWMSAAATEVAHWLEPVAFSQPRATLVCNHDGAAERDAAALRLALAGQIARTVPWDHCMDAIAERRVRCVLEVGPGSSLARLWSERHPGIPARSVDEFRSAVAVARWVAATLA